MKSDEHGQLLRPILTTYYKDVEATKVLKTTHSKWAVNAVPNCVKHMQLAKDPNSVAFGAALAEVSDLRNGKLHAVIHNDVAGEMRIVFQRKVKEGM